MAEPFLTEIRIMSFGYAPRGWTLVDGQLLPINQNQTLFSLLGTTYGGNGKSNFALPDLQGRGSCFPFVDIRKAGYRSDQRRGRRWQR